MLASAVRFKNSVLVTKSMAPSRPVGAPTLPIAAPFPFLVRFIFPPCFLEPARDHASATDQVSQDRYRSSARSSPAKAGTQGQQTETRSERPLDSLARE